MGEKTSWFIGDIIRIEKDGKVVICANNTDKPSEIIVITEDDVFCIQREDLPELPNG